MQSAWLQGAASDITTALGATWTTLSTLATTIGEGIADWLGDQSTILKNTLGGMVKAMTDGLSTFTTNVGETVANALGDAGKAIGAFGEALHGGAATFAKRVTETANNAIRFAGGGIKNVADSLWTLLTGGVPEASAEEYDSAADDSAGNTTNRQHPALLYTHPPASTATDATHGTQGDIDLKTHDIANVDRLFFKSNDSLSQGDSRPHITSYNPTADAVAANLRDHARYMQFQVPRFGSFDFFRKTNYGTGRTAPIEQLLKVSQTQTRVYKNLQVDGDIEGDGDLTVDRMVEIHADSDRTSEPIPSEGHGALYLHVSGGRYQLKYVTRRNNVNRRTVVATL